MRNLAERRHRVPADGLRTEERIDEGKTKTRKEVSRDSSLDRGGRFTEGQRINNSLIRRPFLSALKSPDRKGVLFRVQPSAPVVFRDLRDVDRRLRKSHWKHGRSIWIKLFQSLFLVTLVRVTSGPGTAPTFTRIARGQASTCASPAVGSSSRQAPLAHGEGAILGNHTTIKKSGALVAFSPLSSVYL